MIFYNRFSLLLAEDKQETGQFIVGCLAVLHNQNINKALKQANRTTKALRTIFYRSFIIIVAQIVFFKVRNSKPRPSNTRLTNRYRYYSRSLGH